MRPDPPTDAEWKVIRWFFGVAFGVAILYVAWAWHERRQECIASCEAKGFQSGCLRSNTGNRFNIGTHCVCKK